MTSTKRQHDLTPMAPGAVACCRHVLTPEKHGERFHLAKNCSGSWRDKGDIMG